jgi:AcrR family transcriptional regulator
VATSSPARRVGGTHSKTRAKLVDAAGQLMLEEGYAAVTSRRVGAEAGVTPQLVHYYFRTMDELFIAIIQRIAEANLARLEEALRGTPSLRTLWKLNVDPRGAAFSAEIVALANHRKAIRSEIAHYAERARALQIAALAAALEAGGVSSEQLPPMVALLLLTGLSQVLTLEEGLGVTSGHEDTLAFVEKALDRLEPAE